MMIDSFELLASRAAAWIADDPDFATRAELIGVLDAARAGDPEARADLASRMDGTLEFGTAGLRGALGAGSNRMNRAVVIRAAAGLVAHLQHDRGIPSPIVVIGFDARHGSSDFARDTAAVVTSAGGRALLLPGPLPTPVLAYAIRHEGADAGVMVTASHNPAADNGYKVYLGDGSQIVPPTDAQIAGHIASVDSILAVARAGEGWTVLDDTLLRDYLVDVARVVASETPRALSIVHTSMHGVGNDTVLRAFAAAGFEAPHVVAEQADPDPDFPTVAFPNPEEKGALDRAFALAASIQPDLIIANDPDADRCAAAVVDVGGWRMLHGDELGVLLGSHLIDRGVPEGGVVANSIVSSRMLAAVASAAGVRHAETLTGFKWIARVPNLAFGYEEALGYCVAPEIVADKDGISAALLLADLAATLKAKGETLLDRLDSLYRAHGVYLTDAMSVRVTDLSDRDVMLARLRENPPRELAGVGVARLDDLAEGGALPPTEGLRFTLADNSRIIVRPSGTEPKLKVYLEAVASVGADVASAKADVRARLAALKAAIASELGV
jgi:phosphomannomutase